MTPSQVAFFLLSSVSPAFAQIPTMNCIGTAPDWRLALSATAAHFSFENRQTDFDVPQFSHAEGREWPLAMTLIARNDTAIVILKPELDDYVVDILTQRGTTPILLTGQCEVVE